MTILLCCIHVTMTMVGKPSRTLHRNIVIQIHQMDASQALGSLSFHFLLQNLTLPKTNSQQKPLKIGLKSPKRNFIFQPSIFSGFCCYQWSFLVPLIGGRYHIIPQLAVYTTYIPLIVLAYWVIIYHRSHLFSGNERNSCCCSFQGGYHFCPPNLRGRNRRPRATAHLVAPWQKQHCSGSNGEKVLHPGNPLGKPVVSGMMGYNNPPKKWGIFDETKLSKGNKTMKSMTFHWNPDWCIGILILAYYVNPDITG